VSNRTARTVNGILVRLYQDVLQAIFRKHGELRSMTERILEAVRSPDLIPVGHAKELLAIRHYPATPVGPKDMVVVYREDKHLIITAFLTSNRLKLVRKRIVAWQKQSK
jgi:hypothetical protein